MTVALTRAYGAYPAGAIVSLPASTEAAIIAQNIGTASAAAVTAGAITSNEHSGRLGIAAGTLSTVVTNPNVNPGTKIEAVINQAAADGTLTSIMRVVPGNGQFTVYGNANATAVVQVDWQLLAPA